jgi:hypothetical protein
MELTLHDLRRLVDIGTNLETQHKEFMQPEEINTTFKPHGEKVFVHVNLVGKIGSAQQYHNYRYKVDMDPEVPEGEGWPISQIGYDNYAPEK